MPMNAYPKKEHYTADDLLAILAILHDPENGCPWDKVQTHESIRTDLIEETYEVCEGIDKDSPEMLREELGDLLLQIVFHAQIEREKGTFDFDDVCNDICQKLVYRHPHVFGEVKVKDSDDVLKNWDALKRNPSIRKATQRPWKACRRHSLPCFAAKSYSSALQEPGFL